MGPATIPQEIREKYFRMLGIPPLPEKGDYFVTSDAHMTAQDSRQASDNTPASEQADDSLELIQQLEQAMKRPWSRKEFPIWAKWLEMNEKPLVLLVEASKRPHRYDPLMGKMLLDVQLSGSQATRDVGRALVARAMLRVQEGKVEEAWRDLLACHRLARLVGQGPTIVEALVAITIDYMAQCGDAQLLEHSQAGIFTNCIHAKRPCRTTAHVRDE